MSELVVAPSLKEFFKALLLQVTTQQRVELADVTEFYLVNLLADFAAAEKLFSSTEDGRKDVEPLALLYYRALQQRRDEKREGDADHKTGEPPATGCGRNVEAKLRARR